MARGSSAARNRSTPVISRRGPARAGAADSAAAPQEPVDVFDYLARCSNLLTTKELAALLAVSPKTVYSYVTRNIIPHYKIASSVRFRARDIAEWLRSHAA
jgi:excisionase family DNA binding protein